MTCKAIEDMRRQSYEEGFAEGYAESREEVRRIVVAVMREHGYDEEAIQAVVATAEAGRALPVDPSDD